MSAVAPEVLVLAAISFPILERIPLGGDLAVSPHGIGIALGFLFGAAMLMRRADKRGLAREYVPAIRDEINQVLGWVLVGVILGARLFYVLTHLDVYAADPLSVLAVWEGGLTFLGGLAGGVAFGVWRLRSRGWSPLMALDSAAPGIAAGLVIGRLGDLVIGDHIGLPAGDFPLGWRCSGNYWERASNSIGFTAPQPYPAGAAEPPTQGCFDVVLHQTALYDFLAAAIVVGLILWLERRPRWDGFFVATFVYGYGALRFLSDFAREDRTWFALTGSQWAIIAAVIAMTVYLRWRRPWHDDRWAWDLAFDHPWLRPPAEDVAADR